jgi:hypothetical protein
MTDTPLTVLCIRIADMPIPAVSSSAHECLLCGAPVWLAHATAAGLADLDHPWIVACGACPDDAGLESRSTGAIGQDLA